MHVARKELVAGAAIVIIALAALIPTRSSGFESRPAPARDYADAVRRILARQAADDRVDRAVIVSPVFAIGRVPSFLDAPLMHLALRIPNLTRSESPDSLRPDRELGVSTRAIAQILQLGAAVRLAARSTPPRTHDIVFLVNGNDHTVKSPPAVALARRWSTEGARVAVYQFPRSLGLPHDIAEEAHPNADPGVVYPALEALIHGETPPPVLAKNRLWPP